MGLSREDAEKVLGYIKARAVEGVCRLGDEREVAQALNIKPGRVKVALYWLCGAGIILRQGDMVLILREMQETDRVE